MDDMKFKAYHPELGMVEVANIRYRGFSTVFPKTRVGYLRQNERYRSIWDLPEGSTVVQFTGKQDSNGVDIYIGDIVKAVAHEEYADDSVVSDIIKDEKDSMQIQVRAREDGEVWSHGLGIGWGGWESIKVIGNIYENPELLEAKK